jgi:tetratricopeptide (TPR) repeat protein
MKLRLVHLAVGVALVTPGFGHAHDTDSQSGPLGKVTFPTSCDPKVQASFERAVAMLHSFWYSAGEQAFRDVLKADPQCAVATWGIASILMSNPLAGQGASPKGAEASQAAIDEGRRIGAKTERERDYIEAVAAYYKDFSTRSERERQVSRAQAYEALAQKYKTDDEAQIFFALYLAGTQTQADQTYAAYLKAAAILEDEFRKYPDHPGVAHYLIHSYDAPPIADKGLIAARRYAGIAPAAPHALHMPSHIFTRVGSWQESVVTNTKSRDVAIAGNEPDEAYHASDYMVYADLQLARDAGARRDIDAAMKVTGISARFVAPYAIASMPARLRLRAWRVAGGSEAAADRKHVSFRRGDHVFHAQPLRGARGRSRGREEGCRTARIVPQGASRREEHVLGERGRGAAACRRCMDRSRREEIRRGAQAHARSGRPRRQEREAHRDTGPHRSGARALGDMLLELKQPDAALKEYEASQSREPNRFRNYAGSARACGNDGRSGESGRLLPEAAGAREGRRHAAAGADEREEDSDAMSRIAGLVQASLLCAAIVVFAPIAAADPDETDPDLAKRDADYAAGKRAADSKDWTTAVRLYERAEKRNPDHADLQNSLGYAYRNLKEYDLALQTLQACDRNRSAPPWRPRVHRRGVPHDGDPASAEKHLAALRQICLLGCEELKDLERAVAEYRKQKR